MSSPLFVWLDTDVFLTVHLQHHRNNHSRYLTFVVFTSRRLLTYLSITIYVLYLKMSCYFFFHFYLFRLIFILYKIFKVYNNDFIHLYLTMMLFTFT